MPAILPPRQPVSHYAIMCQQGAVTFVGGFIFRPKEHCPSRGKGDLSVRKERATKMRVGIDSYCYHRLFGDVYPHQKDPGRTITLEDFLKRAKELGVDGVSLESSYVPSTEKYNLAGIKGTLDEYGMDRVWAWGHPDGLEGG